MALIQFSWPEGKEGAFTSSWDDGTIFDYQLVKLYNERGLKATWNLNSGLFRERSGKERYILAAEVAELYNGHEVACHSFNHPFLEAIPNEQITSELLEDRKNLERLVSYPVRGLALPYGTYDKRVLHCCKACGIQYVRLTTPNDSFRLPDSFLEWRPTCRQKEQLVQKWEMFKKSRVPEKLFYVWGHSIEFDRDRNWDQIAEFLDIVQADSTIWCATNLEVYEYVSAWRNLACSVDGNLLRNVTSTQLWVRVVGEPVVIRPGEIVSLD